MAPSVEEIARVPAENIHVSRAEFAAVWTAAEQQAEELNDWYSAAVCVTCRWVAMVTVKPPTGPWYPARSPVSSSQQRAYAELVEAESLAAEVQAIRWPEWLMTRRPGWVEAIDATFAWLWRGSGVPPVTVERMADGPAGT